METSIAIEYKRIQDIIRNDNISRFGKLFSTNFCNHFYDTGTGKVLDLEDEEYEVMQELFSNGRDDSGFKIAFSKLSKEKQNRFLKTCIKENLLRAEKVSRLQVVTSDTNLEEQLNCNIKQLVLEVTEVCNFRCKYCIYNEEFLGNRNFGTNVMNIETAKKAIDYTIEHCGKRVSITFYGGEPLLNFEVIKDSIEYALEVGKDKEITFSITSNMTKMTKEIASYLAAIPGLSLLVSIDGPEEIHNSVRVYQGNRPTFNDVIRGLKYAADAFGRSGNILMINTVFVPPYEYGKIEAINKFFEEMDFLPEDTEIRITYPELDSYQYNNWESLLRNEKYIFHGMLDPLKKWQLHKAIKEGLNKNKTNNIYFYSMFSLLQMIDARRKCESPFQFHSCNGCCVPGGRKIYVKSNGDILVCEKIGNSPIIGNINVGIDIEKIKHKYIEEYANKSLEDCSNCWAINLCNICYANCYTTNGIDMDLKRENCASLLETLKTNLSVFYSIAEEYPELLDVLKGSKYSNP